MVGYFVEGIGLWAMVHSPWSIDALMGTNSIPNRQTCSIDLMTIDELSGTNPIPNRQTCSIDLMTIDERTGETTILVGKLSVSTY